MRVVPDAQVHESDEVLRFENVSIEADESYDSDLWQAELTLNRGALALVRVDASQKRILVADAAVGTIEPNEGAVYFNRVDWQRMSPRDLYEARGKIGRVFEEIGWISNLDIDENIALPHRYHFRRDREELYDQAAELSQLFELPGLPRGRPSYARPADLQRAACVRAFLGEPQLLILERPERDAYPDIMPPLLASIRAARNRGAAVLWLTAEPGVWNDPKIGVSLRCIATGSQMFTVPEVLV